MPPKVDGVEVLLNVIEIRNNIMIMDKSDGFVRKMRGHIGYKCWLSNLKSRIENQQEQEIHTHYKIPYNPIDVKLKHWQQKAK